MRLKLTILITTLVLVAALVPTVQAQDGSDPYQQLVMRALSELGTSCANIELNDACIGFPNVEAEFFGESEAEFSNVGDRVSLADVMTIRTSSADLESAVWGIATLYVEAEAGAEDPTIFVLLGNVEVENNVTPEMLEEDGMTAFQSFDFTTDLTTPPSMSVPPSVLMIQSPLDQAVELVVNGHEMIINGTVFLRSGAEETLEVITVDGDIKLLPETGNEVDLVTGTAIELAEQNWDNWRVLSNAEWDTYESVESIPNNVMMSPLLPHVDEFSGVGDPPIIIIRPSRELDGVGEVIMPVPPTR